LEAKIAQLRNRAQAVADNRLRTRLLAFADRLEAVRTR